MPRQIERQRPLRPVSRHERGYELEIRHQGLSYELAWVEASRPTPRPTSRHRGRGGGVELHGRDDRHREHAARGAGSRCRRRPGAGSRVRRGGRRGRKRRPGVPARRSCVRGRSPGVRVTRRHQSRNGGAGTGRHGPGPCDHPPRGTSHRALQPRPSRPIGTWRNRPGPWSRRRGGPCRHPARQGHRGERIATASTPAKRTLLSLLGVDRCLTPAAWPSPTRSGRSPAPASTSC